MDLFDILTFVGGLAFFMFGMNQLSAGLETMVGGRFEQLLAKMTSNRLKALGLGALVTALVQSSSAITVMVVGLVNSGIMNLTQSVGVIMGSNIGTTITAWILSLVGIESGNVFIKLLKPDSFAPVVALVGIILLMFFKTSKKKNLGTVLIGFAVLIYGMSIMGDAVSGLQDVPEFGQLMVAFSNPIAGILAGAIITAVIQSSSASVGILQSLSLTGAIPFASALPIIMGQNIGTCVTALISSVGTTKNAKRVTAVHIYFNVLGTLICLPLFLILSNTFNFSFVNEDATPVMIAVAHTIFNIVTTILLFPLGKFLQKLAEKTVKDKNGAITKETMLDDRLLISPGFAIVESRNSTIKMAEITKENIIRALTLIGNYDKRIVSQVEDAEGEIDMYEDKIGAYLIKINQQQLTGKDNTDISQLLQTIGDLERISDHAVNITEVANEIYEKGLKFSDKAMAEIDVMIKAVEEILELSISSFTDNNNDRATYVEPLEEVVDGLKTELRNRHIKRLQEGKCTIELGFVLSDLITNLERVSDHCSNIAISQLEANLDTQIEAHDYVERIKERGEFNYNQKFDTFLYKYRLPKSVSSSNTNYQPD